MTYNTPLKFNIILRDTSKWHIDMTYISPLKFNLSLRGLESLYSWYVTFTCALLRKFTQTWGIVQKKIFV